MNWQPNRCKTRTDRRSSKPGHSLSAEIRRGLLRKVRRFWLEGVLIPALHGREELHLDLEVRSVAGNLTIPQPTGDRRHLLDVNAGETLLILGSAGAGKTILLLLWVRDRLELAENNPNAPIPLIFDLASWPGEDCPIAQWTIAQLHTLYQISPSLAREWFDDDGDRLPFILCLEGLDALGIEKQQPGCEALNRFIERYPDLTIIGTSRTEEAHEVATRVQFDRAIGVRSPTAVQIQHYFNGHPEGKLPVGGDRAVTVLTLKAIASHGGDLGDRTIDNYIQTAIDRACDRLPYRRDRVRRWLLWLAQRPGDRARSLFYLEQLHSDWLPHRWQYYLYIVLVWIARGILTGPTIGMGSGVLSGLAIGSLRGPVGVAIARIFQFIRTPIAAGWLRGIGGSLSTLTFRTLQPLAGILGHSLRRPIARLLWNGLRRKILRYPYRLVSKLIFRRLTPKLVRKMLTRINPIDRAIDPHSYPNQGIWKRAKQAAIVGCLSGILAIPVAVGFAFSPVRGAIAGFLLGIFAAGNSCIQHLCLRLILTFSGHMPWKYADFLDRLVTIGLMYKVGGGYLFVHRQISEYLSACTPQGRSRS
jgi:hypothetical protein